MPEFIDVVFAKTSPKQAVFKIKNERFGLEFAKTGPLNSGKGLRFYKGSRRLPVATHCWVAQRKVSVASPAQLK